jgi:hypothetical protein
MAPGMKQFNECSGCRVNARSVRPLTMVACETCQRKISRRRAAAMFDRNDVIEFVGKGGARLRE